MKITETSVESLSDSVIRVTTTIDLSPTEVVAEELGEGAIGDTVADRIVRHLIDDVVNGVSESELKAAVEGEPVHVRFNMRALALNDAEIPVRLRGWVRSSGRGQFALTSAALRWVAARSDEEDRRRQPRSLEDPHPPSILDKMKPFVWSTAEATSYEVALEAISDVLGSYSAILAEQRAKAEPDERVMADASAGQTRCADLRRSLDPLDPAAVLRVRKEYSELSRQLRDRPPA